MEENNELGTVLPPEIYEHIFSFLDGYTLLQIEKVCSEWREIVQWLGKKSSIWKRACLYDMPEKVYLSMLDKSDCEKKDLHEMLYRNWISWQHVSNYESLIVNSKRDNFINNVTCAKISGNHIIYGTLQGAVGILLDTFEFKEVYEPSSKAMVIDVYFMNPMEIRTEENYYQHSHLLAVYNYEVKLFALFPKLIEISCFDFPKSKVSVYANQICISDPDGYIEIFEVDFNADWTSEDMFVPVTCFRLYRPIVAEHIHVFNRIVTIVTKSKIYKVDFNKDSPKWKLEPGQMLPFPADSIDRYWSFYHEVVFANGYADLFVATISNNKEQVVSHKFNWMECLGARISEIYYHGNILFVMTHAGQVFFYVITDWSTFDLNKYDFKLNLKGSPILTVHVQEIKNEHRLLVATNESIFQVFLYPETTS